MKSYLLAVAIVIAGLDIVVAKPPSPSTSPRTVVQSLMSVPGHYQKYATVSEIETIKAELTPELYSTLIEWATFLAKVVAAAHKTDYNTLMMLPGAENVFFGENGPDNKTKLNVSVTGETATVMLKTTMFDTDEKTVLRKTRITFFLVAQNGEWIVKDVQRVNNNRGYKEPFTYDLIQQLQRDIVDFKKKL